MRQEVTIGDTTNPNVTSAQTPNTFQIPLWWKPNIMFVLNNTSNPVFINEGRLLVPTTTSYDTVIPPGATLRLPVNSNEFAGFLPLSPAITDPTQTVKIIFDQVANA